MIDTGERFECTNCGAIQDYIMATPQQNVLIRYCRNSRDFLNELLDHLEEVPLNDNMESLVSKAKLLIEEYPIKPLHRA